MKRGALASFSIWSTNDDGFIKFLLEEATKQQVFDEQMYHFLKIAFEYFHMQFHGNYDDPLFDQVNSQLEEAGFTAVGSMSKTLPNKSPEEFAKQLKGRSFAEYCQSKGGCLDDVDWLIKQYKKYTKDNFIHTLIYFFAKKP